MEFNIQQYNLWMVEYGTEVKSPIFSLYKIQDILSIIEIGSYIKAKMIILLSLHPKAAIIEIIRSDIENCVPCFKLLVASLFFPGQNYHCHF